MVKKESLLANPEKRSPTNPSSIQIQFLSSLKRLLGLIAANSIGIVPTEISDGIEVDLISGILLIRILEQADQWKRTKKNLKQLWHNHAQHPRSARFHNVLREYISRLCKLEPALDRLRIIQRFRTALTRVLVPDFIWHRLINELLYQYQFTASEFIQHERIGPAVLGLINETIGMGRQRHGRGVFYTSKNDAELVVKLGLSHWLTNHFAKNSKNEDSTIRLITQLLDSRSDIGIKVDRKFLKRVAFRLNRIQIIDLACGAGALLVEACSVLFKLVHRLGLLTLERVNTSFLVNGIIERCLFGCDTDDRALAISEARLWLMMADFGSHKIPQINLVRTDALLENSNSDANSPQYDLVIGNPPFVRHEIIGSNRGGTTKYKQQLHEIARKDWPDLVLNGRSDLHTFFFLRGISLLKPRGVLSFISPNAWLDVAYGEDLQQFLLDRSDLRAIISSTNRSFTAAVNTIITVAGHKASTRKETVEFVTVHGADNCSLTLRRSLGLNQPNRISARTVPKPILSIGDRNDHGTLKFEKLIGRRWSIYHRAPNVFFDVLSRLKPYLKTLGQLGKVRYPIKTGINEFFFLSRQLAKELSIEPEYLVPVVKSPKEFDGLRLTKRSQTFLFSCDLPVEELVRLGHNGAARYIHWGIEQKTSDGTLWPAVASVRQRANWYSVPRLKSADILCNRFFDRRFFFGIPARPVIEDQTFYGLTLNTAQKPRMLQSALLNSTLSFLIVELFGRIALGEGVLQYAKYEMSALPALDASLFSDIEAERTAVAFEPLLERPIESIFDEVKREDRLNLDAVIGEIVGVTKGQLKKIYLALIDLVSARLEKATSIKRGDR